MLLLCFTASGAACLLALLLGHVHLRCFARKLREPNHSPSPRLRRLHAGKEGTPTLGGWFILAAAALPLLLLVDRHNSGLVGTASATAGLALIGLLDDLLKLRPDRRGLRPGPKLLLQFLVALPAAMCLVLDAPTHGPLSLLATTFLIVTLANAVNLTDGLDGLAAGTTAILLAAMALLCGLAACGLTATSSRSPADLATCGLVCASAGALLGFLAFNRHPARIFMGDTGALALGGLIASIATAAGLVPWLPLIGCVLLAELLSVIVQVASFRATGRRVLRCAPLHHHFQFLGWHESRIVRRFWLAGAAGAALAISLLAAIAPRPSTPLAPHRHHEVAAGAPSASQSAHRSHFQAWWR